MKNEGVFSLWNGHLALNERPARSSFRYEEITSTIERRSLICSTGVLITYNIPLNTTERNRFTVAGTDTLFRPIARAASLEMETHKTRRARRSEARCAVSSPIGASYRECRRP